MRILHFSDTHVGSERYFEEKRLLEVIDTINTGKFDLAIHTGDITDEGQRDEYERAKAFIDAITTPLIVLPGNHDGRSGGLALFEQYIGPSDGYRLVGDALVVFASSIIADSNAGRIGRVRFDLLKDAIYDHASMSIKIFCTHHHILPVPSSGRERNVLENAGDILDLIVNSDVDLVLMGHRHFPNVHRMERTVFINAGTASSSKTRYGDVQSHNEITIDRRRRRVSTIRSDGRRDDVDVPKRSRTVFTSFGARVLRIVHMANSFISESRLFLETRFQNALESIRELEADVVVHCGGVVAEGTQADYERAVELLGEIDPPLVVSPSGRDMNYLGYELFARSFGSVDPSYETDRVYLQGVASFQYDSTTGVVGRTGRARVFEQLRDVEQEFTGIFLHHNLVPVPHSRNKALLEDAGDFLRELVDSKVDIALTGTSSHPHAAQVGSTVISNAGSVSSIYQRSAYGNSFNLVDVYEKAIAVSEISSMWGSRRLLGMWERRSQR